MPSVLAVKIVAYPHLPPPMLLLPVTEEPTPHGGDFPAAIATGAARSSGSATIPACFRRVIAAHPTRLQLAIAAAALAQVGRRRPADPRAAPRVAVAAVVPPPPPSARRRRCVAASPPARAAVPPSPRSSSSPAVVPESALGIGGWLASPPTAPASVAAASRAPPPRPPAASSLKSAPLYSRFALNWVKGGGCDGKA